MSFFDELKRRNVFRVAIAYIVMSWVLLQVIDILFEIFSVPSWAARFIAIMLALGFVPAILFAWAFEITPEGIKPESQVDRSVSTTKATGRKLDNITITLLLVSTVYFFWESRIDSGSPDAVVESPEKALIIDDSEAALLSKQQVVVEPASEQALEPVDKRDIELEGSIKSIAVLPFVNISSDPEQEYFSDGIAEELLNVLTKLPNLQVAARTSSFRFKGKNLDIGTIAEKLNVSHILEGSVRKGNDNVRVTAQLIEAKTGYHLWSENYDRPLEDILAIQDDIAAKIANALSVQLVLRNGATYTPQTYKPASIEAYEAFIRGRHLLHSEKPDDLLMAREELVRALELDPKYAAAHAELAIALLLSAPHKSNELALIDAQLQASEHIDQALKLDVMLAEAYAAQSLLFLQLEDYDAAVSTADKAIKHNPNNTSALKWRSIALGKEN